MDVLAAVPKELLFSGFVAALLWGARLESLAKFTKDRMGYLESMINEQQNAHRLLEQAQRQVESQILEKLSEIAIRLARVEERVSK